MFLPQARCFSLGKGIYTLKNRFLKKNCNSSVSLDFKKDSLKHECCGEVFNQAELGQKCTQMLNKQPELLYFNSAGQSNVFVFILSP